MFKREEIKVVLVLADSLAFSVKPGVQFEVFAHNIEPKPTPFRGNWQKNQPTFY
jgi:hypothetical protein